MREFQSTLPRRERQILCIRSTVKEYFNPRSREGSDQWFVVFFSRNVNFNPRSREGSDFFSLFFYIVCIISIHAPAKGATMSASVPMYIIFNFNPRSREGSDSAVDISSAWLSVFQSTLPRRERLLTLWSSINIEAISIHAPAKGATANMHNFLLWYWHICTILLHIS